MLCVPVPEKPQRQFNFCIIPRYGDGVTTPPSGEATPESIVWNVPDGPPKAVYSGNAPGLDAKSEENTEHLIGRMLDGVLTRTSVIRPDEREFVSATPEAHRKREKAYHAKAFRGSKEGTLDPATTCFIFHVRLTYSSVLRLPILSLNGYLLRIQKTSHLLRI